MTRELLEFSRSIDEQFDFTITPLEGFIFYIFRLFY